MVVDEPFPVTCSGAAVAMVAERLADVRNGGVAGVQRMLMASGHTMPQAAALITAARARLAAVTMGQQEAHVLRATIAAQIETELTRCDEDVYFKDEVVGKRRDHGAVRGYLSLLARLHGLEKLTLTVESRDKPVRDMTTAELEEELAKLEAEGLRRGTIVDATVDLPGFADIPCPAPWSMDP